MAASSANINVVTVVKDESLKSLASTIEGVVKVTRSATAKLRESADQAADTARKASRVRQEVLLQAANVSQLYLGLRSAVSGLQGVLGSYADTYNNAAVASKKLEVVMRQRMDATEDDIKSIKAVTNAQKELGIIGGSVQNAGAQQVATFLTQSSTLRTLIPAMNNLLAQQKGVNASQEDAVGIGNLMGKAMQGQTSALRRVGITFSEAEEKILKYGTESERAATLAKVITNNVGEMNAKLAQTDAGKMKQLQNAFGGIKYKIGKLVTEYGHYLAAASQVGILVSSFGQLANVVKLAGMSMWSFGKTLWASIRSVNLYAIAQRVCSAASLAFALIQKGIAAALGVSTVAATAMTAAVVALGAALVIGPIIWGVVAAVRALSGSSSEASAATRQLGASQRAIERINQRATEQTQETILVINNLSKRVHDNNLKLSDRKAALERLQRLVPDYLASYTKEGKLINDNTEALTKYIAKLKEKAYAESLKQEMVDAYTKQRQAQREVDAKANNVRAVEKELQKDHYKSEMRAQSTYGGGHFSYETNDARISKLRERDAQKEAQKTAAQKLAASNKLIADLEKEAEKHKAAFAAEINKTASSLSGSSTTGGHTGGGGKSGKTEKDDRARLAKEAAEQAYKYIDEENEYAEKATAQRLKNLLEARQQEINLMQDGKDKELAQIALNYDRQKQEADEYRREEVARLQEHLDKLWELDSRNKKAREAGERNPVRARFVDLTDDQKTEVARRHVQADTTREAAIGKVAKKYAAPARLQELHTVEELTKAISHYQDASNKQSGDELYNTQRTIAAHEEKLAKLRNTSELLRELQEVRDIEGLDDREMRVKIRAIGFDELTSRIQRVQKQLADPSNPVGDAQRKDIEALIQTYTQWRATSVYSINTVRKAWEGIQGVGDSISSLVDTLEGTGSAWQKITASVQAFFSVMDGVKSIIEVVRMIETVSKATTVAKAAETATTVTNTTAMATEASVAVGASAAKAAAFHVEAEAAKKAAAATIFAVHAAIPFAGIGIAGGQVALMVATLAALPVFADGGIAYGPTVGLFGEYAGASHNPEVVAPLDKLRSLIAPQGGAGGRVEFRIEGRHLVGVLNKESRHHSRNY